MKFFTKSCYALRVMIELARRSRIGNTPLKSIAESQNSSLKYLEQEVIAPLNRTGLVKSERGSQGGYRLAMPPELCTAGEAILAPVDCLEAEACDFQKKCSYLRFWSGFGDCIEQYADSMTLRDLASMPEESPFPPAPEPMTSAM